MLKIKSLDSVEKRGMSRKMTRGVQMMSLASALDKKQDQEEEGGRVRVLEIRQDQGKERDKR